MKKTLASVLLLASALSQAGIVGTPITKIALVSAYNQYGGGDVVIRAQTNVAGCEDGFWMTKSDAGYSANLALILSAYHAKSPVTVYGLSEQIWAGSAGKFCKLYNIELS